MQEPALSSITATLKMRKESAFRPLMTKHFNKIAGFFKYSPGLACSPNPDCDHITCTLPISPCDKSAESGTFARQKTVRPSARRNPFSLTCWSVFEFLPTTIEGCYQIRPRVLADHRGTFSKL